MELIPALELKPASRVKKWSEIKKRATELVKFLDENNFKFKGEHAGAYALHHCQVSIEPYNFFVVSDNVSGKDTKNKDQLNLFKQRIVINPEILEMPEKVTKEFPNRKEIKENDKVKIVLSMEKKEVSNVIDWDEGCMSFPHRKSKNVKRFFEIKVRYQIPWPAMFPLMLLNKTEIISGLKSHIWQHEVDHSKGINIYHGDQKK